MCFYSARISSVSALALQTSLHRLSVVSSHTTQVFISYFGDKVNWVSTYEKLSYSWYVAAAPNYFW